ncbi:hypothetical protein NG895_02105 [Aeoliella sp. ICT_H6.2]|uniref:YubB ferredoxin-like domain-containing protein n=1 Tax=Aeoliella straminimaris TaxID=2954799 RepID=A0A9X2JH99_9BACT|nr:hypothetical protein [Aeoliella straminimaris]MCO6042689.1 hypothetical protein [Aeoliella straminimaris]
MPNHVQQSLTCVGQHVADLINHVKGDQSPFDFNQVIPMPAALDIEAGTTGEMGVAVLNDRCHPFLTYPWVKRKGIRTAQQFRQYVERERPEAIELGKQYLDNQRQYGHTTWYSWRLEHWGTKWNAYNVSVQEESPLEAIIRFETAWSPAIPVVARLSELYPNVRFTLDYVDECLNFAGTAWIVAGQVVDTPCDPCAQH